MEYDANNIFERLARRFGQPQPGGITERLYLKVASIVAEHGELAYRVVCSAASDSVGKGSPDRYFAKVVIARLREHGLLGVIDL